ncbi:MAG TPA: CBS domain-containing protein [Treponemataceae bacterium]|jgi:CBS domain-containing protein|nr:MAG: CBS domain-containing protein [Treponema sp.]HOC29630.1 CBS domain-containing protein [Treponemataceae bacterium]HPX47612.1 CBS domain-containing protein [Treponemataceae bacterium]HQL32816.1 CBS domain-containing protein [Treponemataceae bacterium]
MLAIPIHQDNSPEAVISILFKLKVKDVMTHPILTASPSDTLRHIQQVMKKNHITGIPVADSENRLLGIVSMDDIVTALDNGWIEDQAGLHMTTNVIVLEENMSLSFCVSYFNKYSFGRFPVLDSRSRLVGIVTASDVISTLLVALNKEVERLEHTAESAETGPAGAKPENSGEQVIEFKTEPFNFEIAGQASTEIKKLLKSGGIDTAITRRVGIASYELEINQVVHSAGGIMRYILKADTLVIEAEDTGPGIPNLEKAMTEGFSTANERVRSLGFGAGMGLPNTKRVADEFYIDSAEGRGTLVRATFNLKGSTAV